MLVLKLCIWEGLNTSQGREELNNLTGWEVACSFSNWRLQLSPLTMRILKFALNPHMSLHQVAEKIARSKSKIQRYLR